MRRKILRLALFFSKCNLSHWCQPALLMILLGEQVLWMSDGIKEWNNNIFLYILMLSMGILLSKKTKTVLYHNSRRNIMRGNCHHWSFITVYYYYILCLWRYFSYMASLSWVNGSSWEQSSVSNYLEIFLFFLPRIFLNWNKFQKFSFLGNCLWKKKSKNVSSFAKKRHSFIKNSKGINVNTLKR